MNELTASFPREIKWSVTYDTTKFVNASVELVMHTFVEAFVLVLIVVYVFLGSMRATIIPLLAIPVSIVGTMAGLLLAGFSINMLTLFGLVLAIGIVVDDAIVVVEAVEKIMHDEHLDATAASIKAMQGIGGAIVGVTAVICAVFVPIAFLGGVTGTLYKQFAITITIATLLSAITALTLTPALCALILKPGMPKLKPIQAFDRFFERVTRGYVGGVARARPQAGVDRGLRGADRRRSVPVRDHSRRLRARGRQGHDVRRRRPAGRRLAGAHARSAEEGRGHPGRNRRCQDVHRHPRLFDLLPLRQPGLHLRDAQALGRTRRPRDPCLRLLTRAEREVRRHQRGARVRAQRAADLRHGLDRRLRLPPAVAGRRPRQARRRRRRVRRRRARTAR